MIKEKKIIAASLVSALSISLGILIARGAKSRLTLSSFFAGIKSEGEGNVSVWFSTTGVEYKYRISRISIAIKKLSGVTVKTFCHEDYLHEVGKDRFTYGGEFKFAGKQGTMYYAVVKFSGDANVDLITYTTPPVKAS